MRFHRLDLNHLVTLETLLTEHSLTRAAERLSLTQPAVSNALNKLREFFGDELLVRRGRDMACTPFAQGLLPELRTALLKLRGVTLTRPQFDPKTALRQVKIAASDYVATIFVTEIARLLSERAPHVSLSHVPMGAEANTSFERGEIDAIILPEGALNFAQHPKLALFSDQFVCVARAENPLVGDTLTLDQYYSLRRIVPPYNLFWPEVHLSDAHALASVPATSLPFSAAPWLVSQSDYIAILPERLALQFESWLRLKRVSLPQPLARTQFVAQWHADTANDPFKFWLLDQMREIGEALESLSPAQAPQPTHALRTVRSPLRAASRV